MTFLLLDVASYQGDLQPADVKRAGFDAVNLKVSHGLSRKSVHPRLTWWIDQCRELDLGISTFHYLTAAASGQAQATYAHQLLTDLGLAAGAAHQLDVESDPPPSLTQVRDYLETMTEKAGRPVALYTGDWWWTAQPGWKAADLTPYLWAAPNVGYLGSYPGDDSTHWVAGYGGWSKLSVMQYAVEPLTFSDGSRGTIKVSKSAIRDPSVWVALTGGAMSWGGLNPALTAWRDGVNALFPGRGRTSDGGYADAQHGSTSQHQADADGTVDAFDEDVNLLGSGTETGTAQEKALVDALNRDFEADSRAHLWISRRRIAQHDQGWDVKDYGGVNPHDHHTHRQVRQDRETDGRAWKFPHATALLKQIKGDDMPTPAEYAQAVASKLYTDYSNTGSGLYKTLTASEKRAASQAVAGVKAQLDTMSTSLREAIKALAAKDTVDEKALSEALVPGLVTGVLAALPEGAADSIDAESLQAAIVGALVELATRPASA